LALVCCAGTESGGRGNRACRSAERPISPCYEPSPGAEPPFCPRALHLKSGFHLAVENFVKQDDEARTTVVESGRTRSFFIRGGPIRPATRAALGSRAKRGKIDASVTAALPTLNSHVLHFRRAQRVITELFDLCVAEERLRRRKIAAHPIENYVSKKPSSRASGPSLTQTNSEVTREGKRYTRVKRFIDSDRDLARSLARAPSSARRRERPARTPARRRILRSISELARAGRVAMGLALHARRSPDGNGWNVSVTGQAVASVNMASTRRPAA